VYRHVVVPLDGSPLAEAIVPFIVDIAGPLDLEVTLVRVVQPIPPQVLEGSRHVLIEDIPSRLAEAGAYLEGAAARLESRGIRVRTAVRRGDPVIEIVSATKDAGADLIAMTTHGRSGFGRLLFGSVAEAVLRQAEIPVFLMRLTEKQGAAMLQDAVMA
jgi:nucleotide-binding universal stress UspA family protein